MTTNHFFILLVGFFLIYLPSGAQSHYVRGGAKANGVANSAVTFSDAFSSFNNIAGISSIKRTTVAAHASQYYFPEGIGQAGISAVHPLNDVCVSATFSKQGDAFLNFQRVGIGVGHKVGFMQVGFQANYIQYSAEEFGTRGAMVLDLGGIAELGEKVKFGVHVFNFTQSSIKSRPEESLPVIMKAGLSYMPAAELTLLVEIEKEIGYSTLKKVGIEYEIVRFFYARTGVTLEPVKNFFGLGYDNRKRLAFDYAFQTHWRLGMSHHLSISYRLGTADE